MTNEQAYKYLRKVYSTTKNDSYREALSVAVALLKNRKTARIDREAWGCELCKDAKFVSGIAYSEKQGDKDHACAVSFSDEGADCDFYYCPNCGKPLTPEAWDELEKGAD